MTTTLTHDGRILTREDATPRIMPATLQDWAMARADYLIEDGATAAMVRGYLDAANGRPVDLDLFAGDPFGADDYHAGYGLARYEIGPIREEHAA